MSRDVKIGLTLLGSILALYLTVTWLKSSHLFSANRVPYVIRFDNVSGLRTGDPVRVFGYPAGNVTRVQLDRGGVEVHISIDPDITLYEDAVAEILMKELMGGKMLEIDPGEHGNALASGGRIQGRSGMDYSTVFARMGDIMEQLSAARFDTLLQNINRVAGSFADIGESINPNETKGMVHDLHESASLLNDMLRDTKSRALISKVDRAFTTLDSLSDRVTRSLTGVDDLTARINNNTLPQAEGMMSQISSTLDEAERTLLSVKDLLDQAKDKETVVGRLFYDPELARQFDETVANLNKTLDHLRTKKIFVSMSLSKKQKAFDEEVEDKKKKKDDGEGEDGE